MGKAVFKGNISLRTPLIVSKSFPCSVCLANIHSICNRCWFKWQLYDSITGSKNQIQENLMMRRCNNLLLALT